MKFLLIPLAIAALYLAGTFYQKELVTKVTIATSPGEAWQILSQFEQYGDWNPFVTEISGNLTQGSFLNVMISPPGGKAMGFTPVVLKAETNKEFRWQGRLLLPRLFDGEHYFIINQIGENHIEFIHGEIFSGLLAAALLPSIFDQTQHGFEAMNNALKDKLEAG